MGSLRYRPGRYGKAESTGGSGGVRGDYAALADTSAMRQNALD